jgi:diguanylate cyclase (GGDEF)-like protein
VTISIGVAQTGADCATSSELLRRADAELYRAKQEGRNRVCCAGAA